jgi:type IV pilus biogenesis/stability protein PilW
MGNQLPSILDALGRKPAGGQPRRPLATVLLYGLAAFGIGFAGLTAVVLLLAPAAAERPARSEAPPSPEAAQTIPSIAAPTDLPRTPSAGPFAPAPVRRPRVGQPAHSAFDRRQDADDRFDVALGYQRSGDFDRALAEYRALLARDDRNAPVHDNLGLLYADRGRAAEAMKEFRRAIEIDPSSVKAHNNLGVLLMRGGRLDEAADEFRVALAADAQNVEALVNLALVQNARGRAAEAKGLLQRAVRIDPDNAGSHYNLAVVADESGDTATAVEHYRAFLGSADPANSGVAAQVRARLLALGG